LSLLPNASLDESVRSHSMGLSRSCAHGAGVEYWVVAWDSCIPCNEGVQSMVSLLTGGLVLLYLSVVLRLSTLHQDLSRLPLIPSTHGFAWHDMAYRHLLQVVHHHLLSEWRNESVPAAGPFTRDARQSWLFNLQQTMAKVVIVFLSTFLRHHNRILVMVRVVWAGWLVWVGVTFRPFVSNQFCRLQVTLKAFVLYACTWSVFLLIGAAMSAAAGWSLSATQTVRALLSIAFLVSIPPFWALTWRYAGWVYGREPSRPSVSRSYVLARALVHKQHFLNANTMITELGSDADGKRFQGAPSRQSDLELRRGARADYGSAMSTLVGAASIELIA
jgi:hypothetical protein